VTVPISAVTAMAICIIIFFLSYLAVIYLFKPPQAVSCVDRQKELIKDFDNRITQSKETFKEFIEPFEMKWCAKCIWYNVSAKGLAVIFLEEKTPILVKTENVWEWPYTSKDNALISPGYTYRFWIRPHGIECLNCKEKVGSCSVD